MANRTFGALALLAGMPMTVGAQSLDETPQIAVSASAGVQAEPDRAVLQLAVATVAETAQQASRENAEKMTALLAELRRLGLSGDLVKTVSYSLEPEYRRPQPRDPGVQPELQIVGYRATNMVRVIVDSVPRVGEVIDAAVAEGGNRVTGLHFEISDPGPVRAEALREATRIAREEARLMAEALDLQLGEPLRVSTSYSMPVPQMAYARVAMEAAQSVPTPIEPGSLEVRADVHIVFAIAGR